MFELCKHTLYMFYYLLISCSSHQHCMDQYKLTELQLICVLFQRMFVTTRVCHIEKAPVGKTDVTITVLVWTVKRGITDVALCKFVCKFVSRFTKCMFLFCMFICIHDGVACIFKSNNNYNGCLYPCIPYQGESFSHDTFSKCVSRALSYNIYVVFTVFFVDLREQHGLVVSTKNS